MKNEEVVAIARDHFNALADMYDAKSSSRNKYLSTINSLIVDKLRAEELKFGQVLDIGCGTGTRTAAIFSLFPSMKVYGSDISMEMLKRARNKNLNGLICSDMQSLPFRSEYFEIVTCLFNAIGYLGVQNQRTMVFEEIYRVLKPGGLLFIDFMNRWHLGEGLSFKRSAIEALRMNLRSSIPNRENQGNQYFNLQIGDRQIKGFVHGFTYQEIITFLARSRFQVEANYIVGYDSGELKRLKWHGQIFFIARKGNQKN